MNKLPDILKMENSMRKPGKYMTPAEKTRKSNFLSWRQNILNIEGNEEPRKYINVKVEMVDTDAEKYRLMQARKLIEEYHLTSK